MIMSFIVLIMHQCSLFQSLLLSGDVELNPGLGHNSPSSSFETIANAISRLKLGQNAIIAELTLLRAGKCKLKKYSH